MRMCIYFFLSRGKDLKEKHEQKVYEREMQRITLPLSAFTNPACELVDENTIVVHTNQTPVEDTHDGSGPLMGQAGTPGAWAAGAGDVQAEWSFQLPTVSVGVACVHFYFVFFLMKARWRWCRGTEQWAIHQSVWGAPFSAWPAGDWCGGSCCFLPPISMECQGAGGDDGPGSHLATESIALSVVLASCFSVPFLSNGVHCYLCFSLEAQEGAVLQGLGGASCQT